MMSKRVYIEVASILHKAPLENSVRALLIVEFAAMFKRDNSAFNYERFSDAVWQGHNR